MKGFYLLIVAATVGQAMAGEGPQELNIECIESYPSCPGEENENSTAIHLPYPGDCHKFYKCQHGGACIFPCPWYANGTKQLVFDPELQICDFQFNVKLPNCTAEVTPTPTPSTTPMTPSTTPRPSASTAATAETTNPTTSAITVTPDTPLAKSCQPGYACPSTGIVRVKHETDCSYFYNCINGTKKLVKCPNSLVFNCNTQMCDYPKNYSCKTIRPIVPY